MLWAIIVAFSFGGFLGFILACLVCSRTMGRNVSFPERFYRYPVHSESGKFLAN